MRLRAHDPPKIGYAPWCALVAAGEPLPPDAGPGIARSEAVVWVDAKGVRWLIRHSSTIKATGTPGLINQMTTAEVEHLRYRKAGSPLLRLDEDMAAFQTYLPGHARPPRAQGRLPPDDMANLVVARSLTASTWITEHGDLARGAAGDRDRGQVQRAVA